MIAIAAEIAIIVLFPPMLLGFINKTKAFWAGCQGPPLMQAYYDIKKNLAKDFVFSTSTSWVFKMAPLVTLVAVFLAGLTLPVIGKTGVISFSGNFILFVYLLALARFFMTLAALDTASSFEGMGAAREVTFACFSELALFFVLLIYAKLAGSLQLDQMLLDSSSHHFDKSTASLIFLVVSLFIILLVENCRIPFDDPNTHLELTMVHEAMVLDHSGPLLGLITYGAALRLYVLGAVLVRTVFNINFNGLGYNIINFMVGMVLLCMLIGTVESMMARLKLLRIPNLIITSCVLAMFGLLFLMT
jgi:formate hydrogenlyase subunit 4